MMQHSLSHDRVAPRVALRADEKEVQREPAPDSGMAKGICVAAPDNALAMAEGPSPDPFGPGVASLGGIRP